MRNLEFDPREKSPLSLIVNEYNSDYLVMRAKEELLVHTSKKGIVIATQLLVAALAKLND